MPRKLRELRSDLRRSGFVIDRRTGSHETWKHPTVPSVSVTLAGGDGADARPYQEDQVKEALRTVREIERRR
jgi:predicted RNA binding protein YcfA (HicA-like mRNA interferase family)